MVASIKNKSSGNFTLNGIEYHKTFLAIPVGGDLVRIVNGYDTKYVLLQSTSFKEFEVDGATYSTREGLISALAPTLFSKFSIEGVAQEFQNSVNSQLTNMNLAVTEDIDAVQNDVAGFKSSVTTEVDSFKTSVSSDVNNFKSSVNNDLSQIQAEKQAFETEVQQVDNAIANMTTTGKIYNSLAEAQAVVSKPEDGTPFSVINDLDPTENGYYKFDSSQAGGTKFGRKFDRRAQIESVALLRLHKGRLGEAVDLLGYYQSGDGGGGLIYWDNSSTEADNGGTVFQVVGVAIGRWKRIYSGTVDVRWFGAKSGGSDNSSIFNLVFNKYKKVILGGGEVFYSGPISVDNIDFTLDFNGSSLLSTGNATHLLQIDSDDAKLIYPILDGPSTTSRLLIVNGANFYSNIATVLNGFYGIELKGENPKIGIVIGKNSGYGPVRLNNAANINSVKIGEVHSVNSKFKGFVANNSGTIEQVYIGLLNTYTETLEGASDGFLVDSAVVGTKIKNLYINKFFNTGSQSNGAKILNVGKAVINEYHDFRGNRGIVSTSSSLNATSGVFHINKIYSEGRVIFRNASGFIKYAEFGENIVLNGNRTIEFTGSEKSTLKIDYLKILKPYAAGDNSLIRWEKGIDSRLHVEDIEADGYTLIGEFSPLAPACISIGQNVSEKITIHPWMDSNSAAFIKKRNRVFSHSSLPTGGAWKLKDFIYNSNPEKGSALGWICTKGGDFSGDKPVFLPVGIIGGLNIGGRNYAKESDILKWSEKVTDEAGIYYRYTSGSISAVNLFPGIEFEPGSQYVLSVNAEVESGSNPRFQIFYTDGSIDELYYAEKIKVTDPKKNISHISHKHSSTGWNKLYSIKIEKGNTPTDFSPAPEDFIRTLSGNTESRPTLNVTAGSQYFDTTLNKPIWYNGSAWVDATGATV